MQFALTGDQQAFREAARHVVSPQRSCTAIWRVPFVRTPLLNLLRAGLTLPRRVDELYQWPDFNGFLEILCLAALVLRRPDDFTRAVYA